MSFSNDYDYLMVDLDPQSNEWKDDLFLYKLHLMMILVGRPLLRDLLVA